MKSIRNFIVRTDIKEADGQKRPQITIPCYSCRKTCHLISSDETLKNILNGKEIKKLDGGNCRTANIVCAARCKTHGDIYIGKTGEELREDSANTSTMAKTDQIAMNSQRPYTNTNTNLTKYWSFDIKRESTSKAWKRVMRRQIHLFTGYKSTYGTQYRIETLRTWVLWSLGRHYCVKYGTFA